MYTVVKIIGSALALTLLIFIASLIPTDFPADQNSYGQIENIRGIPYPEIQVPPDQPIYAGFNPRIITEELAHTDIFLRGPVLGKRLFLIVVFKPGNVKKLSVGVRQDSFWLSYADRETIFPSESTHQRDGLYHALVEIPLTDKLQETDRSIDLMFFAEAEGNPEWELHFLNPDVDHKAPLYTYSYKNFKDYVRSILKRERAL